MSQQAPTMEEVLTFGFLFKLLSIPTIIGTITGLAAAYRLHRDEMTFKHIVSNCGISSVFCWITMLITYEWTAVSPVMKIALCIAVGLTSTHWDKHFISILYMIIERFIPLSRREQMELRKLRREQEDNEYRSPKKIPKEFLDDEDGTVSFDLDDDSTYCDYPAPKKPKVKKKPKDVEVPKKEPATKKTKKTPVDTDSKKKTTTPKKRSKKYDVSD